MRQLRALNIANTHLVTDSILLLRRVTLLTSLDLRNTLQVDGDLALEYLNPEGQFCPYKCLSKFREFYHTFINM